MPPCLSPWTVTTSWLPGTVSLPWCVFPFPPVFSVPVVLCSQPSPEVEAVVKDTQSKLTVAWRECKHVLVRILGGKKAKANKNLSVVSLIGGATETLWFLYRRETIYGQYKTPEAWGVLLTVRSSFSPMEMHAGIQNSPVYCGNTITTASLFPSNVFPQRWHQLLIALRMLLILVET